MKSSKISKFIKVSLIVLLIGFVAMPGTARAEDGKGGDGGSHDGGDGGDREGGGGGSVPVNGGIAILTLAGVAYCAKKFYDLKHPNKAVA